MKENYSYDIDFGQIANSCGYSYDRFRHIFQAEVGKTMNQYLLDVRFSKAKELLENLKRCARRAYKWYVGGNNFCAEIFEIRSDDKRYPKDAGTWQVEIISNYIAELNGGEPFWHKKYPTARRVMSLRINDLVIAEFSKDDPDLPAGLKSTVAHQCAFEKKNTVEIVLRVKSLDAVGKKVWLRAHYVAKENKNTQTWQAPASGLQLHKARKIFVSPTGKILK